MTKQYTAMSLADVIAEFDAIARDAAAVFGQLDERQLNWRPDPAKWSVAQCFDHLLNANREMFQAIDAANEPSASRTIWQRLPLLPRLFGRVMVRSQMPDASQKFTAPAYGGPGGQRDRAGHHRSVHRAPARGRRARSDLRGPRRRSRDHGVAVRLVHHLQRARRLPADRHARATPRRAGPARHAGAGIPVPQRGVEFSVTRHDPRGTTLGAAIID